MPTKLSGLLAALESSEIGKVEVFEPQNPSSERYFSVFLIILFYS